MILKPIAVLSIAAALSGAVKCAPIKDAKPESYQGDGTVIVRMNGAQTRENTDYNQSDLTENKTEAETKEIRNVQNYPTEERSEQKKSVPLPENRRISPREKANPQARTLEYSGRENRNLTDMNNNKNNNAAEYNKDNNIIRIGETNPQARTLEYNGRENRNLTDMNNNKSNNATEYNKDNNTIRIGEPNPQAIQNPDFQKRIVRTTTLADSDTEYDRRKAMLDERFAYMFDLKQGLDEKMKFDALKWDEYNALHSAYEKQLKRLIADWVMDSYYENI